MEENNKIADLRIDYTKDVLIESDVFENPIRQFEKWFQEALNAECLEANAMNLCTISADGSPNSRIVLLKGIEEKAFRFYTNYQSTKGKEISLNNRVTLVFFWPELQRQVRIYGEAYPMDEKTSTEYFHSRPLDSQIGAWASPQSDVIHDRSILEQKVEQLKKDYQGAAQLPKPPHWGGYVVKPYKIEFWQGRSSRLHDRIQYTLSDLENYSWKIERLAP